jgi:glycosyltransferase involved in cell wall biosynthesis
MMPTLSVVIICKNESERLARALGSVAFADEIVVLDSGSTDDTLAIARRYTDRVYSATDWQGFGIQKNRALDLATCDWVLSLDADEWVDEFLRKEIEAVLTAPKALVYEMPRLSRYCGRTIRHSGWWPDYVPRLFQRGVARFSEARVHERLVFEGEPRRLTAPLQHDSFRNLEDVLDKINRYSSAGAEQALASGRRSGLGKAVARGLWAFLRTYLLRAGFLDGREGFVLAVSNAEGTYYRYLKLMYLTESKDLSVASSQEVAR